MDEKTGKNKKFDQMVAARFALWSNAQDTWQPVAPDASDLGKKVAFFLDLWLDGLHHADPKKLKAVEWSNPIYMHFDFRGDIATYDFDQLTRLVVLSHDLMLRVELKAHNFGLLRLTFHQRETRESENTWQRMPMMETHLDGIRQRYDFTLPKKAARAQSSAVPINLEQAAHILNAANFRTREMSLLSDINYFVDSNSVKWTGADVGGHKVAGELPPGRAVHASRILIRRAKPISTFSEKVAEILEVGYL